MFSITDQKSDNKYQKGQIKKMCALVVWYAAPMLRAEAKIEFFRICYADALYIGTVACNADQKLGFST